MKKIYFALVGLLFVGLATSVFAAPPGSGQPGQQGPQKHAWFHKSGPRLNLTDEQKEKMKGLMKDFIADTHDLKYDIKIKKLEARKLFTDPKTDDATLLAKEKEVNALKAQFMDKKAEMKVAWRKILTPDQIRMLDRIHRHHHHRGHWGKGRWQHHHPGPVAKDAGKPAAKMTH